MSPIRGRRDCDASLTGPDRTSRYGFAGAGMPLRSSGTGTQATKRQAARCVMSVPALVLCALAGGALGTGAYTVHYAEALSYLSDDPAACANCHVMRDPYD